MNIVEPILFQARLQPDAPALCSQGNDVVSYGMLAEQMSVIARRALSLGLGPGSVVATSIEQPLMSAAVILGLTQAGIIGVSAAGQKTPEGLKVDATLSNRRYPYAPEAKHYLLDYSWITGSGTPVETTPVGAAARDNICRIVLTSGTTGDPKAIALTHDMVMRRNARFEHSFGKHFPAATRIYIGMGLAAALGFQFLTYVLGRGGTLFFRGTDMENTLRSFEIFGVEAMLTTPHTVGTMLTACDRFPTIDVHFDTIISGGGLLSPSLVERLRPRLCTHLITGYGSTETAISAMAPAHRISHLPNATGYLLPGMQVEIVDEQDQSVPAGTEGIVRVASEFGVDGYIGDPVASAKVFRDGWFYPGDLGTLGSDRLLSITGRQNSVLNVGGGKVTSEKIEATLTKYAGVTEAAVFVATDAAGVDEVWAAIVTSGPVDAEALRTHCQPELLQAFVPKHIVPVDRMPLGTTGKLDRARLKSMLLEAAKS